MHVQTRGELKPDPEFDSVGALFYSVHHDIPPERGQRDINGMILVQSTLNMNNKKKRKKTDVMDIDQQMLLQKSGVTGNLDVHYVCTEQEMFAKFVELVVKYVWKLSASHKKVFKLREIWIYYI